MVVGQPKPSEKVVSMNSVQEKEVEKLASRAIKLGYIKSKSELEVMENKSLYVRVPNVHGIGKYATFQLLLTQDGKECKSFSRLLGIQRNP